MKLEDVLSRLEGVRSMNSYWIARCPAHDDRTASLSIREGQRGRVLLYCFAGCNYGRVSGALGLPSERLVERGAPSSSRHTDSGHYGRKLAFAARIWHEARPAGGTLAERYLRARGICIAIPDTLRFHPSCSHPSGANLPALVAAVTGATMEFRGIHRIFLRTDGSGKADTEPSKRRPGVDLATRTDPSKGHGR
jgi:hypothetical protein